MGDSLKDITSVAMAIVGLALLYTLVNRQNQTPDVIRAASGGFAQALSAAMGGGTNGYGVGNING